MQCVAIAILLVLAFLVDLARAQFGDGQYPSVSVAAEKAFKQGYETYNAEASAPNYGEARRQYLQAAELGHPGAMTNLGLVYSNGLGVKKDQRVSAEWFERGSRAGDPNGTYNLALQYSLGAGVPRDLQKARHLYEV